ncbi:unnamed protein product, partial [Sphacelaria rigidula]
VILVAFIAFLCHMISDRPMGGGETGLLSRVARRIPLHSLKIIIVSWQILTQFSSVANVTYPGVYEKFLSSVDMLNFDLSWVLSTACIFNVNFHDRLLISTLGPLVFIGLLYATYTLASRRYRRSSTALGTIRSKH